MESTSLIIQKKFIVSPAMDSLLIGGLSIILFAACYLFLPSGENNHALGWTFFYLSFVVNFPHFMATYYFLYKDYRADLLKKKSFFWAGVIAPLVMFAGMTFLLILTEENKDPKYISYLANLLFFLVGHHYVKQVYGCYMVTSAKQKIYYNKTESWNMWFLLMLMWMMSFIGSNSGVVYYHDFFGIKYSTLGLSSIWMKTCYILLSFCFFHTIYLWGKRYIDHNQRPPLSGLLAVASLFLWYYPPFYHKTFFLMIPFFHSLQYLLFAYSFKLNKDKHESEHESANHTEKEQRKKFLLSSTQFFAVIILTGYLFWEFIPKKLDSTYQLDSYYGPTLFMFLFHIFLNIHHYLIDNVIWRKDNQQVKQFL